MTRFNILYVYILYCSDGTYYTGVTNDLDKRFSEHETGCDKDSYTYTRRPLKLVWYEMFNNYNLAIEWETRIKKWSKKKKEALINSDWKKLVKESECKNETSHKLYVKPETNGLPEVSTTLDLTEVNGRTAGTGIKKVN